MVKVSLNLFGSKPKNDKKILNKEFYRAHPDLCRDVYLYTGRIMTKESVDKEFNQLFKESPFEKLKRKLKNLIKK